MSPTPLKAVPIIEEDKAEKAPTDNLEKAKITPPPITKVEEKPVEKISENAKNKQTAENKISLEIDKTVPEQKINKSPDKNELKTPVKIVKPSQVSTPKANEPSVIIPIQEREENKKIDQTKVEKPTDEKNNAINPTSGAEITPAPKIEAKVELPPAQGKPTLLMKGDILSDNQDSTAVEKENAAKQEIQREKLKNIQIWEGKEGAGLKRLLRKWTEQAGIKLTWETKESYDLEMDLYVSGTFENALKTLFSMGVKNGPKHTLNKDTFELTISDP